jgi:glycosyltransferase involved in cell wall biosynthesis
LGPRASRRRAKWGNRLIRVRFDDQIVMHQRRGGVSRYFVELVREFRDDRRLGVRVEVNWRRSRNAHAIAAGFGRPTSTTTRVVNALSRRLRAVRPSRPDVYHPTYYYPARLPTEPGPPMVVTVVDMIPELMPELFLKGNPHLAKHDYVRRASAIVCISESTRRDLLRIYGPIHALIEVIPLGVSPGFRPGQTHDRPLPDDYILYLGSRAPYKDFGVAAEALAAIRSARPGVSLVVVGGGQFTKAEQANLERLSIEGQVHRVDATDAELPALFGAAKAFVFPSRYEGFGLPTLEAMACGTPAVLANSSSHPEAGGDAALYFEPGDASALAAQVLRLLGDADLRAALVTKGLERAAGFTWRRTAARTREVYAKVVAPR